MRAAACLLSAAALSAAIAWSSARPAEAVAQETSSEQANYLGPGSCASSGCHGSVQPREGTRVLQNEYSVWVVKDRHSRAYSTLTNPTSARIAKNLGLERAETASQCLACHALNVPASRRGQSFDLSDGVSCESCHGPAEHWLGPHTVKGWDRQQALRQGMYDTKDAARRAEKCLSCHLGTGDRGVDHELTAAGHPALIFELDSFTASMPRHWREPAQAGAYDSVRLWSVGQAVHLRESARQVERRSKAQSWPEYAEYRCEACHHDLTPADESWRQQRGYQGRRPGAPPWNAGRHVLLRALLRTIDLQGGQALREMERLEQAMSSIAPDRAQAAAAASGVSAAAQQLISPLENARYDRGLALRLMRNIVADAEFISGQGASAAEQAVMTMASLYTAYEREAQPSNRQQVRAALDVLFRELRNPSAYEPQRFAAQLRAIEPLLGQPR